MTQTTAAAKPMGLAALSQRRRRQIARLGGLAGGKARAKALSRARRREIARQGAEASQAAALSRRLEKAMTPSKRRFEK